MKSTARRERNSANNLRELESGSFFSRASREEHSPADNLISALWSILVSPHQQVTEFKFYSREMGSASTPAPCASSSFTINPAPPGNRSLGDPLAAHLLSLKVFNPLSRLLLEVVHLILFSLCFPTVNYYCISEIDSTRKKSPCVLDWKLSLTHLWIPSSSHGLAVNGEL